MMGQQLKLPEGWKVDVRVRKSGRKDRYYVEPANGYIFRSLKDIDRYLLTGKLGRHVTKTKPKDDCDVKLDANPPPDEEKDMAKEDGMTLVEMLEADGKKVGRRRRLAGKLSKRKDAEPRDLEDKPKKKRSASSSKRNSRPRPSRKKDAAPFFILDSDQCEDSNDIDIPNLTEIIDSIQKEKEGQNTVYLSASDIGSLLGAPLSENWGEPHMTSLTLYENYQKPGISTIDTEFNINRDAYKSENINIMTPCHNPPRPEKRSKEKEEAMSPVFGDLLTDPCIDFAIKTLTGTMALGSSESGLEEMIARERNPC